MENQVEQVLNEADRHAVHRAKAEGGQQGRQLGDIHLHKAGDEHGQAEVQKHQHGGHGGQHSGDGEFADVVCGFHKITSRGGAPFELLRKPVETVREAVCHKKASCRQK